MRVQGVVVLWQWCAVWYKNSNVCAVAGWFLVQLVILVRCMEIVCIRFMAMSGCAVVGDCVAVLWNASVCMWPRMVKQMIGMMAHPTG
jgi:hypothetical protein